MGTLELQAASQCRGNPAEEEGSGRGSLQSMFQPQLYVSFVYTSFLVLRATLTQNRENVAQVLIQSAA